MYQKTELFIIKPSLRRAINGLFHTPHKAFHGFSEKFDIEDI
jgi:hypothetical protein